MRHANKPQCSVWYTPSFTTPSLAHHLSHTVLSHTIFHTKLLSFTHNFHTDDLSHTTLSHTPFSLSHTIFDTQHCHIHTHTIFLRQIQSFTYHFVTHNSSHPTCFTSRSSTTAFVFPSFPVPARIFAAHYWKKLTCGVIRSFN